MTEQSRADIYGSRARIGYTSPPLTTEVFPYEFYKIVPDGVTLVVTSLAIVVRSKDEVDQSYDISMRAAREMAAAGCDIVVLGGVPINLSRGAANARADDPRSRSRAEGQGLDHDVGAGGGRQGARLQEGRGLPALREKRNRPHRELRQAFRLRGIGRDRLGFGVQPDRPHPAPCRDRHGARTDASSIPTPIRSCSRRRIGRPRARSTCWRASSASTAWRRTRRSSGTRCAAAASRTDRRLSAGCFGNSSLVSGLALSPRFGPINGGEATMKTKSHYVVALAAILALVAATRPVMAQQTAPPLEIKAGISDPVNTVLAWYMARAAGALCGARAQRRHHQHERRQQRRRGIAGRPHRRHACRLVVGHPRQSVRRRSARHRLAVATSSASRFFPRPASRPRPISKAASSASARSARKAIRR